MIDPQQLDDILEVLSDRGATHFSCPEFSVTLGPAPVEEDEKIGDAIKQAKEMELRPRAARGVYGNPSLWGGGEPPRFPGAERATPSHVPTHPDSDE